MTNFHTKNTKLQINHICLNNDKTKIRNDQNECYIDLIDGLSGEYIVLIGKCCSGPRTEYKLRSTGWPLTTPQTYFYS